MTKQTITKLLENVNEVNKNLLERIFHYKESEKLYKKLFYLYRKQAKWNNILITFLPLVWFLLGYWYGASKWIFMTLILWIFIFSMHIVSEIMSRRKK